MSHFRSPTRLKLEAYEAGRKAWAEQIAENSNPYDPRTVEAQKWSQGWKAAQADSLLHEDR